MAKKLEILGTRALFVMSLKGGDLPENFEAEIAVEMDFNSAPKELLYKICASGQSARVALQSQLRKKSVPELQRLEKDGLIIKVEDIYSGQIVKPVDRLLAMSKEDFIETMMEDLGLSEDQAIEIYNRKHGIVE